MQINTKMVRVLNISKVKKTVVRIHIRGKELQQVKEFSYMYVGSIMITENAT